MCVLVYMTVCMCACACVMVVFVLVCVVATVVTATAYMRLGVTMLCKRCTVSGCNIGVDGATALATALQGNTSLTSLHVGGEGHSVRTLLINILRVSDCCALV